MMSENCKVVAASLLGLGRKEFCHFSKSVEIPVFVLLQGFYTINQMVMGLLTFVTLGKNIPQLQKNC
jgi:hypothetical protein